jgi:hypothetical protein
MVISTQELVGFDHGGVEMRPNTKIIINDRFVSDGEYKKYRSTQEQIEQNQLEKQEQRQRDEQARSEQSRDQQER